MRSLSPSQRRIAAIVAVAAVGVVVDQAFGPDGNGIMVVDAAPARRPPVATAQAPAGSAASPVPGRSLGDAVEKLDLLRSAPHDPGREGVLFGAVAWSPPAPTARPAAIPPPSPPVAPPFPYPYIGGLVEDGVRTAFFMRGERVLPVKAGDTVDSLYHVDQLDEKEMTITFVPLNQAMTVATRSGG